MARARHALPLRCGCFRLFVLSVGNDLGAHVGASYNVHTLETALNAVYEQVRGVNLQADAFGEGWRACHNLRLTVEQRTDGFHIIPEPGCLCVGL
mgnify:CR=1 FL=1